MIVVTGASGTIGSELVRLLSAAGTPVRALSRRPEEGADLPGIAWTFADLGDPPTLRDALTDVEQLFLVTGNSRDMVRLQRTAIDAAVQAGATHIVKVSALGASDHSTSVIGLWHHVVERHLASRSVTATVLRPHHFMQNLLSPDVLDIAAGVVRSASGDGRIPFIDTRDIARVAAALLTEPDHRGGIHTLTGPEAISYREAVDRVAAAIGRDLRHEDQDLDQAWRRLRQAGHAPWLVASQLEIARYQRAGGPTARTTDTVRRLTGRTPYSISTFAADHRRHLTAPAR